MSRDQGNNLHRASTEQKTRTPYQGSNTAEFSGENMAERDVIKSLIDFSFIIKAQLSSDETALLRSLLSMTIMEAEDVLEMMDSKPKRARSAAGHGSKS